MKVEANTIILLLTGIFFSILFLQSGLDKVFNWKSELEFNRQHFSKTFLNPFIHVMLAFLILMELTTGILSFSGLILLCKTGESNIPFYASCFSSLTFIYLFLGQRISKDYAGAQSLVSYFIVSLIAIYMSFAG